MSGSNRQGRRQALLAAFDRLDEAQQQALMDFAAQLVLPANAATAGVMQPEPPAADESVVSAIRRLTRSYPAAERRRLMGPVSALMAQHSLQGRAAVEVIAELEAVFARLCPVPARSDE